MPAFTRTIGVDYLGAETPSASLKGLRVYLADGDGLPVEVPSPRSPLKYCTRKGIAEWLVERLGEDVPTLVGIGDQHHAVTIAAWLWRADRDGNLAAFLNPVRSPAERAVAQVEGWILGVPVLIRSGEGNSSPGAMNV